MDIRQALEAADKSLTPEPSSPDTSSTPAPEPVETSTTSAPPEAVQTRTARPRAEDGTFTKAPKDKTTQAPAPAPQEAKEEGATDNGASASTETKAQGKEAGAASPPAPASTPVRPPQSWSAQDREVWGKIPAEAQKIIERREREVARAMNELGSARQERQRVQATLAPYETLARANGMDTMQYAGSILQTAAALQVGTPAQKAAVVAQILHSYGVDVDMVNQHLQGQAPQSHAPARPPVDPREEIRRVLHEEAQQAAVAKASQALEAFVSTQPEFLDTVWDDMQHILEAASKSNNPKLRNMTFEDAYSRACSMHPEVSAVIEQRRTQQAARTPQPVTAQARAAASSVKTRPSAPPASAPKGIRGALSRAAEDLGL